MKKHLTTLMNKIKERGFPEILSKEQVAKPNTMKRKDNTMNRRGLLNLQGKSSFISNNISSNTALYVKNDHEYEGESYK